MAENLMTRCVAFADSHARKAQRHIWLDGVTPLPLNENISSTSTTLIGLVGS